jgi:two-component sensor histidine kinase
MKSALFSVTLFLCFQAIPLSAQQSAADSIFRLAMDATSAGNVEKATTYFLEAQKLAEAANDESMLCRIFIGLGKLGLISENDAAVVENIRLAEQYCGAKRDTINLARLLMQKGILSIKSGNMEDAIEQFKTSSAFFQIAKDTMAAANALAKVGNVLERQGRYAEANSYYLELYQKTLSEPESNRHLTANIYLATNYAYLHLPEKAVFHNDKVKAIALKSGARFEYSQALRNEAFILSVSGQHKAAFDALEHYLYYYQDTLMNQQRLEEAEEMKVRYEAEKKEAQIALQNQQLEEERLKFWVATGGLIFALVVGTILFFLIFRLRQRNREKEFLIKEIHHRVKNNLQILSSLLHLQSRQITDDTALDAVREGQNRVDAMGLIHQKLYMGDNTAQVAMKDYLAHFSQNILDSFGIDDDRVRIDCELESVMLDVDTAIPLGLIINELVTNSLKYAFPDQRSGRIVIALQKDARQRLQLDVSDNGIGQTIPGNTPAGTGFGASLVNMLSKKLKGKVAVSAGPEGYHTRIVFG